MPHGFRVKAGASAADEIYEAIRQIPRGTVATYGQIAQLAGLPSHARMVGWAMRSHPEGVDIPWYRVVNSGGRSSLPPGGEGARLQRSLLEAEGVEFSEEGRISLRRFQWRPDEGALKDEK
jgi:methylated-DNA-protein-cysteine methyltransferase related protein